MSDDIVTRLRESNGMKTSRSDDGFMSIHPDTDLMRQAADEIERLRAEIKAFVYQWELSERGVHNGKEYFASAHKLRQEVRGE